MQQKEPRRPRYRRYIEPLPPPTLPKWRPSILLSLSGIAGVIGLIASAVATYSAIENGIVALKERSMYQDATDQRLSNEIQALRTEHRDAMFQIDQKLDDLSSECDHRPKRK